MLTDGLLTDGPAPDGNASTEADAQETLRHRSGALSLCPDEARMTASWGSWGDGDGGTYSLGS